MRHKNSSLETQAAEYIYTMPVEFEKGRITKFPVLLIDMKFCQQNFEIGQGGIFMRMIQSTFKRGECKQLDKFLAVSALISYQKAITFIHDILV